MTTRTEEFKQKLFALFREYDVEMEAIEGYCGYSTVIEGVSFYASPQWGADGEKIHDGVDLELGAWENGK